MKKSIRKHQNIFSCIAFKKWKPFSTVLCLIILSMYSCERADPVASQEKSKPYCYWENGREVCYETPR